MTTHARTGTLETCRDAEGRVYYRGKVRLQDGSRVRVEIEERFSYSEARARECLAAAQEEEDRTHALYLAKLDARARKEATIAGAAGETCAAWFERYIAYQRELGHTDWSKKRDRWNKWIAPVLGSKPIALVTRNDIEDVRDALDGAIAEWKKLGRSSGKKGRAIAGKTAMNVWSCLTSSFKAATRSKRRDLRVLDGKPNPAADVEPPGDRNSRQSRQKTFLFPREAATLLANDVIELEWREVFAVALYTYLRPGELRVLTVGDVDRVARVIHVTKAWDYEAGEVKPPKTRNGVRRVPIEDTLAPLLERLCEGKEAADLLLPQLSAFGEDHLAELWRKSLEVAGLERAELHNSTRTHVKSNFRSCRDSGITWLALAGVDVTKMMRRAGHDHVQTTMGYVKLAEDIGGELGTPFPPLPPSLLVDRSTRSTFRSTQRHGTSHHVVRGSGNAGATSPQHAFHRAETSDPAFDSLLRHSISSAILPISPEWTGTWTGPTTP